MSSAPFLEGDDLENSIVTNRVCSKTVNLICKHSDRNLHLDMGRSTEINKVLVTSSCSTDETVVADSDVEMGTATSIPASGPSEDECLRKITVHKAECAKYDCVAENVVHIEESTKHDNKESAAAFKTIAHERQEFLPSNRDTLKPDSPYQTASKSDGINITSLRDRNEGNVTRKDKGHASESENLDIIYSQDLIVREPNLPQSGPSSLNGAAINFKRFRKTSAPSGNSFNNLIPFSKYPYEESDYGNEDVAESVKEEKKRKQMEAIADDLFNNEKGRKRGASGSLRELFARGTKRRPSLQQFFQRLLQPIALIVSFCVVLQYSVSGVVLCEVCCQTHSTIGSLEIPCANATAASVGKQYLGFFVLCKF
ncbi:UNVERIFIED_CONTAM: Nijmegen breakage syndrome 1 protein [Sesamum indicum]